MMPFFVLDFLYLLLLFSVMDRVPVSAISIGRRQFGGIGHLQQVNELLLALSLHPRAVARASCACVVGKRLFTRDVTTRVTRARRPCHNKRSDALLGNQIR